MGALGIPAFSLALPADTEAGGPADHSVQGWPHPGHSSSCPTFSGCRTSHLVTGCSWFISPGERPSSTSRCYSTWPPTWGAVSRARLTRGALPSLQVALGLRSTWEAKCLMVSSGGGLLKCQRSPQGLASPRHMTSGCSLVAVGKESKMLKRAGLLLNPSPSMSEGSRLSP